MARKIRQYTNPFLKPKGPLFPPEASSLLNLPDAIALHQQGKLGQAEAIYRKLLAPVVVKALGNTLLATQCFYQ